MKTIINLPAAITTNVRVRRRDTRGRLLEAVYTVETDDAELALLTVQAVNETIHRDVGRVHIGDTWIGYRLQTESEATCDT